MNLTTIGLDIAKNVFQVHGVDGHSKVGVRKKRSRSKVLEFFANLSPCLIGIEAYLTILIEALLPKRRILEAYLNVVQYGDGVFGIRAGSETYFGKPPAMLSAREAALLAAVLPNPERYRPAPRPSPHVQARQAWILRQMTRLGGSTTWRSCRGCW